MTSTRAAWVRPTQWLRDPLAASIMLFQSGFEGALLAFARPRVDPTLPTERAPGSDGRLPVTELDAAALAPGELRAFVRHSRPVVLKNFSPELLSAVPGAVAASTEGHPDGKLLIDMQLLPRLGPLGGWLRKQLRRPAIYMARFTGSYAAGFAHIDSLPSYNFYYVHRGAKRAIIIPRQYNGHLDLSAGYDSVFVADDSADTEHLGWLDKLPGYYDIELSAGDVMLFHNSACVHKFVNLTESPEIYTIRLLSFDAAPEVLRNDVFNWPGAKYFADIVLGQTSVRDTYSV